MTNTNVKLLFVVKKKVNAYDPSHSYEPSQYMPSFGLINSASFLANALNSRGIEAKVAIVDDGNGIDREVYNYKPTHVILEAIWTTPTKILELMKLHKTVKWIIRLHSNFPFLAQEGIATLWLRDFSRISNQGDKLNIAANSKAMVDDIRDLFDTNSLYLPNIYKTDYPNDVIKGRPTHSSTYIDIGCFGAIRPLKNQLQQAAAAIIFSNQLGKRLRFHINSGRVETGGAPILKNLKNLFADTQHSLEEHDWLPHIDFFKLIQNMDVSMSVSFSETFNIVTADAVTTGIPVVVSSDISWVPSRWQALPSDTEDIIDKIGKAYFSYNVSTWINKMFLANYNRKSINVWLDYLNVN